MKRTLTWIAVAMLCTAGLSQARTTVSTADNHSPQAKIVRDGQARLEDLEARVADAAVQADLLGHGSQDLRASRETHLRQILQLRDDINRAGKQVKQLEAEQASLAPWERETLMLSMPKLETVAALTDKEIHTLNQNGPYLFANGTYAKTADEIYNNCKTVASEIHTQRALATATRNQRELRQRVTKELAAQSAS